MTFAYEPIADWTVKGRERLVLERGDEIRLILDLAFTDFVDDFDLPLSAFRFRGDDPVSEAVEWAVSRFQTADIDPRKLRPGSRSFRLFTEVSFWLAQREGGQGYRRILREWGRRSDSAVLDVQPGEQGIESSRLLDDIINEMAGALGELRRRTCVDLVGYWLVGSEKLRADLLGWELEASDLPERTPKQRSMHIADALFRHLVLLEDLVDDDSRQPVQVCKCTLFTPCANEPPYRVDDTDVAKAMNVGGSRSASRLRREGVAVLVIKCVAVASNEDAVLRAVVARSGLRSSLLHLYKIDDHELAQAVSQLGIGWSR